MSHATRALLVIGVALGSARAANQDAFFLGSEAALRGGAIVADIHDVEALWYNPAGLGGMRKTRLELSLSAFNYEIRRAERGMTVRVGEQTSGTDLEANQFQTVPSSVAVAWPLSETVTVAAGAFVPTQTLYSLRGELTSRPFGGGIELQQLAQVGGNEQVMYLGPGVGWQVSSGLRLGLSLFGVYQSAAQRFRYWVLIAGTGPDDPRAQGLADTQVEVTRLGLQTVLGAQLKASRSVSLGFTLRSPVLRIYESGQGDFFASEAVVNLDGMSSLESGYTDDVFEESDSLLVAPARLHAELAWDFGGGVLAVGGDLAHPLEDDGLGVDRGWVGNVRMGVEGRVNESLRLGGGLFTDLSPDPSPESWPDLQVDYYGGSVGGQLSTPVALRDAGEPLVFTTTLALRYAFGVGEFAALTSALTEDDFVVGGSPRNVVFHELALHFGSGLRF